MPVEGLPVCAWSREHSIKTSSPCGNDVIAVSKYWMKNETSLWLLDIWMGKGGRGGGGGGVGGGPSLHPGGSEEER